MYSGGWVTCPKSQDKSSGPKLQLWPRQHTAPCYLMYFCIDLSHHMKEILLLGQLLDSLQRFFVCSLSPGVAWEQPCSLGASCDDPGHCWNWDISSRYPRTEILLQGTLVMNFVSFWLWALLFANKKNTHPIRIIVIPCVRKRSKVLETDKQEVSTPLIVGLLCLLGCNVCLL